MKLKVLQRDGSEAGRTVTLDKSVFAIEPNDHTIWLDVKRVQASGRQGTHKAKERAEIKGSTKKLYRQKGTGNARAGSIKSPLRRGGGTVFGPRPRNYGIKINRKTQALARRSVLSYKAKGDAIRVIEDFSFDAPDTNEMQRMISALELGNASVLLLTSAHEANVYRSSRNLPRFKVLEATQASTLDLMHAKTLLIQEGAVKSLSAQLGAKKSGKK